MNTRGNLLQPYQLPIFFVLSLLRQAIFAHQLSRQWVNKYGVIVLKLAVIDMLSHHTEVFGYPEFNAQQQEKIPGVKGRSKDVLFLTPTSDLHG